MAIKTTVTVDVRVTKICPFKDEFDKGLVALTFVEEAPELHEMAAYLKKFEERSVSHEDFSREVCKNTGATSVRSAWTTAGLSVVVISEKDSDR